MAAEAGQPPIAPPAGQGGSGGAQILQQIEGLLAQLAETEPEPEIQQAVQQMAQQVEALQTVVGKEDAQDMQSGLANPTGGGALPGAGGAEEEGLPGGAAAPEVGGAAPGGSDHHGVAEVHIKMSPGGPKTFGDARKAAMAQHKASGHFDKNTPKGQTPSSERSKNKAKG